MTLNTGGMYYFINKRLISVISATISLVCLTISNSAAASSSYDDTDFKLYTNSYHGITVRYPSDWKVDETDPDLEDRVSHVVTFWSPYETPDDSYSESFTINVDNIPFKADLNEYVQESITLYDASAEDFELIESRTNGALAGNPAYFLSYLSKYEEENDDGEGRSYDLKTMEIATIFDSNKGYYVTYIAEEDAFSNYLPIIQGIIDSLQIRSTVDNPDSTQNLPLPPYAENGNNDGSQGQNPRGGFDFGEGFDFGQR